MTALRLITMLDPHAGERVLDVGCGMGEWTARIAESGAEVTGIDLNAALLEQARFKYPHLQFVAGDFLRYEPAAPFDALFSHAALHWMRPAAAAAKMFSCLRPGGRIAVSLGGAAREAANLLNYEVPPAADYGRILREAGFDVTCLTAESDLLLVAARRPD